MQDGWKNETIVAKRQAAALRFELRLHFLPDALQPICLLAHELAQPRFPATINKRSQLTDGLD